MHLCVITPYFYPHPGGSQLYIAGLFSALRKQHPTVEVDVICYNTDQAPTHEVYKGLHIYRLPAWEILPGQFALPNYLALMQLLHRLKKQHGQYALVNSHTRFFDNSWWAPLAAWYLGAKSVLTDHCAFHPQHQSKLINWITKTLDQILIPVIAKQYSQIQAISQSTQKFLSTVHIATNHVIYAGVDTKLFTPQQTKSKRVIPGIEQTFTAQDIIVTFVGRMIPAKGALLVLQAVAKLHSKYPQLQLIFVGSGPLEKQLQAARNQQVHVLGQLSQTEVAKVLNQTNITVFPSSHHEGLPLVLLEAGAAGSAVIASDLPGNREIIQDKKDGLLIQPTQVAVTQALKILLDQPKKQQAYATALNKKIHQFSWDKTAQTYWQAVQPLIQA